MVPVTHHTTAENYKGEINKVSLAFLANNQSMLELMREYNELHLNRWEG